MSLKSVVTAMIICLLVPTSAFTVNQDGMFPFPIQTLNANHDATDMSWMNECPAGKNGFVYVKDGHFADGNGKRIRFMGVSQCFSGIFPRHADADKLAARMAKLGINCVRIHHMDGWYAPNGIWDSKYKDKQHIDADQIDKLDYLIYALKQHGIYVDLNLHVARQLSKSDGFFPDADKLTKYDKGVDNFEPRMIALQKKYAKDLLTHFNPYTKTRYVDEPAVAIIEINNENSLLNYCMDGRIAEIPGYYLAELKKKWNDWLREHYVSTADLRKTWKVENEPMGTDILVNSDLSNGTRHWQLQAPPPARASIEITDNGPKPGMRSIHAAMTKRGTESWHFQLFQTGLNLAEGKSYTLRFWARANQPRKISIGARMESEPWAFVGLYREIELTSDWKYYEYSFCANDVVPNHSSLAFNFRNEIGEAWLAGIELRTGAKNNLPDSASLEAGNIDLPTGIYTTPQRTDFLAFAADTERNYAGDMYAYVKKTLGAKSLVVDTQVDYGGIAGLYRESRLDFGDIHAYWQHPSFPNVPWDPVDWSIKNTPMVGALGKDTLTSMALCRIAGKPFTVSEYNHPAPSDYSAECMPMLAAFAALQDWDGIFFFDYCSSSENWETDKIPGYFDIYAHPAKIAFMPAAAVMFRRADVSPLTASSVMDFPSSLIPGTLVKDGVNVPKLWQACGFTRQDAMASRTSVRFTDKGDKAVVRSGKSASRPSVSWECEDPAKAALIIDSSASRGVIGFTSGREIKLSGLTIRPLGDLGRFSVIMVVSIDGKPIEKSHHLLISAVGRVGNTGMGWNKNRTSVGDKWGTGPVLAEGISANICLERKFPEARVYALDGGGGRCGSVTCKVSEKGTSIDLGPQWKTLWYEVVYPSGS